MSKYFRMSRSYVFFAPESKSRHLILNKCRFLRPLEMQCSEERFSQLSLILFCFGIEGILRQCHFIKNENIVFFDFRNVKIWYQLKKKIKSHDRSYPRLQRIKNIFPWALLYSLSARLASLFIFKDPLVVKLQQSTLTLACPTDAFGVVKEHDG